MRSGALDRLIHIVKAPNANSIPNAFGVIIATASYPAIATRAELLETTADDTPHESGHVTQTVVKFGLRYVSHLSPGDKLTYEGRDFEVRNVKEIGRRKSLEITAIEKKFP